MKRNLNKIMMLVAILILMVLVLPASTYDVPNQLHSADAIWVEEEETPVSNHQRIEFDTATTPIGYKFNVTVYINIDFDLVVWQFGMVYDHNFLKATGCSYSGGTPSYPLSQLFQKAGTAHYGITPDLKKYYNKTHNYVLFAESWLSGPYPNADNSPASVAYVEFEIVGIPEEDQTHESLISVSALYEDPPSYGETYLQDSNTIYQDMEYLGDIEFQFKWNAPPDITVTNVTPSKTVVGQGYFMNITVTAENQGDSVETFNIAVHADRNTAFLGDETTIGIQNVTLSSGNSTILAFTWNTTSAANGNYTISAKAITLPGETYTTDNPKVDGWVYVSIPGDVNGDGKVRVDDILAITLTFGSNYPEPPYEANMDINDDGKIRIDDVLIAATHFGMG